MLQDIQPYQFDNHFQPHEALPEDLVLFFCDGKIFVREDNPLTFPSVRDCPNWNSSNPYLFSISGHSFFLSLLTCEEEVPLSGSFLSLGQLRMAQPAWLAFAALVGFHLGQWYLDNRFCGKCGSEMEYGTKERVLCCPHCGQLVYPRINPAVIVGVRDGERLLLTKYASANAYKHYALVAGFTEIGETIEDTVAREVFEETGLHVTNITFYKSQPWPLSSSLLMGFFCDLDGSDQIVLQEDELSVAQWFFRDEVPLRDDNISLTGEMMCAFVERKDP